MRIFNKTPMNFCKIISIIFISFFSFQNLFFAQTAEEIIQKNIENTGGITNWKLLNTVSLSGKLTLGVNEEYPIKILQARPNLTKTSIFIQNKETVIEGFDGKNGFEMNYSTNKLAINPKYIPENFDSDFIDWQKKGFSTKLLGKVKVGKIDCYKVELIKNSNKIIYFFEVKTHYLIREDRSDESLLYSNFQKVGKLVFPFRIESSSKQNNKDFVMVFNKIETNKAFSKNTFKFN